MIAARRPTLPALLAMLSALLVALGLCATAARAQSGAFEQALAQAVASDRSLAAFYKATGYAPLWTGSGPKARQRSRALMDALGNAGDHALPVGAYDLGGLQAMARAASGPADQARLEAAYARRFLDYVADVQSGVLVPQRVVDGIERNAPRRDEVQTLVAFAKSSPSGFMAALPPQGRQYAGLVREKARLEQVIGGRGWGAQVGTTLEAGASGPQVAALRARLDAMGYRAGSGSAYDQSLVQAVAAFQRDHGLTPDGVVGRGTRTEINRTPEERLAAVVVAMERSRWMNRPLGQRHIWVNLTDFHARVIDNGKTTFKTRSVVGKNLSTHRSPEFSDVMEYMVINPTWYVPRSIVVSEYLPMMQSNPSSVGHLQLVDQSGKAMSRGGINFANYTAATFPYGLREPPSAGNALGTVKFMFPNRHNIYLHDTPSKSLFSREVRAFSHGCIRLSDPHDFAYTLLARQTANPEAYFQERLRTGRETTVRLERPVPVHIVYRTAFVEDDGTVQYRRDVYNRDAAVFRALQRAGVALRAVQG